MPNTHLVSHAAGKEGLGPNTHAVGMKGGRGLAVEDTKGIQGEWSPALSPTPPIPPSSPAPCSQDSGSGGGVSAHTAPPSRIPRAQGLLSTAQARDTVTLAPQAHPSQSQQRPLTPQPHSQSHLPHATPSQTHPSLPNQAPPLILSLPPPPRPIRTHPPLSSLPPPLPLIRTHPPLSSLPSPPSPIRAHPPHASHPHSTLPDTESSKAAGGQEVGEEEVALDRDKESISDSDSQGSFLSPRLGLASISPMLHFLTAVSPR